jgi:hypothetical protein
MKPDLSGLAQVGGVAGKCGFSISPTRLPSGPPRGPNGTIARTKRPKVPLAPPQLANDVAKS